MSEDDETPFLEPPNFLGTPTVERMVEICREIDQQIDAMSPEERAEYLTNRTFEQQRADEKQLVGKSPEERQRILEARGSVRDSIRERSKLIRVPSLSPPGSPFPWLIATPEGLLGAEAALKAKRDRSYHRPKPRSDGL